MTAIRNIPNKIYLQVGDDDLISIADDFKELSEVSWCQDRIYETDIEYVLSAATPPDVEQLRSDLLDILYECNGTGAGADDVVKYLISKGLQAGQSAVQDATDNSTTWKVLNNDKVNSILAIIMRICDEEQMVALKECLIRRTPAVQDATPQEEVWVENKTTDSGFAVCKYNDDEGRWQPYYDVEKVSIPALRSSLSAAQEENKKLQGYLYGPTTPPEQTK